MATYRVPVLGDFAWQPPVDDRIVAPVENETKGYRYIIIASASGIFTGKENQIATAKQANPTLAEHWYFDTPTEGWTTRVKDENTNYVYDGAAWAISGEGANSTNISTNASTNVLQDSSIDSLESEISTNLSIEVADEASINTRISATESVNTTQDSSIDSIEVINSTNASSDVVQNASIDSLESEISTNLSTEVADVASINAAKQDKGTYVSEYGAIEFTI